MSEYQYYGWQAIDRSLTAHELEEVDHLSSHMDEVTSTRASVTYQWGDFKHKPDQILLKYFDVFVYDSNFGYRRVIFRIPKKLLDPQSVTPYLDDENISLETHGDFHILELSCNEDWDLEYVDSDRMLDRLSALREQIIQGDFRALYLAWLKSVDPEDDEVEEPPVPAGLNKLDSGLRALVEFFGLDTHLVAAAAESSVQAEAMPEADPAATIAKLSREEIESHLVEIVRGEAGSLSALKKHLAQLSSQPAHKNSAHARSISEIFEQRNQVEQREKLKVQKEAQRKRIQKLDSLSMRQEEAWVQVAALCQEKRAKAYDEATQILCDLYELGQYQKQSKIFQQRFASILDQFGKSMAFKERLRRAGLKISDSSSKE
jgi:hypothetical protein